MNYQKCEWFYENNSLFDTDQGVWQSKLVSICVVCMDFSSLIWKKNQIEMDIDKISNIYVDPFLGVSIALDM